jgi:hypothetical protein
MCKKKKRKIEKKENNIMARIDFTAIHEATTSFCNAMAEFKKDLFDTANAQRKELLTIYQRMTNTQADIEAFGDIMDGVATTLSNVVCECEDISEKIDMAIIDGFDSVPEGSYEVYVDTCEVCGQDVTVEDEYTEGEFGYVHVHCLAKAGEAQVTEESEDAFEKDELPVT